MRLPQTTQHYRSSGTTRIFCQRSFRSATTCHRGLFWLRESLWKYVEVWYQFHVRLGSFYSDLFEQEMGIPQGSILSVTLFGLKINSIVKAISPGVECSLYVDDFLICYRSKHIHIIEHHLQQCLNKLADWADTNGFKFSPSKTVCVHFSLLKPHPESTLLLNGTPVPVVEETKFLGVIFTANCLSSHT